MSSRVFSLVVYSRRSIDFALKSKSDLIRSYAFICHDSDVDDSGELKKMHYHVIIRTKNPYKLSTVHRWFINDDGNLDGLCEVCHSPVDMFRYFTHIDYPEKYQYNVDDIITNDINFFSGNSKSDSLVDALNDMLSGVSVKQLVYIYGRDFIIHYSKLREIYNEIIYLEKGDLKDD